MKPNTLLYRFKKGEKRKKFPFMLSSSNQRRGNWKPFRNDAGEKGNSVSKGLNCRVQRQRGTCSSFLCSRWSPAVKEKKKKLRQM